MKKTLLIMIIAFTAISCKTTNLESRAKQLEIGMTKNKVMSVMGKDYKTISASKTSEGNLEVISYSIPSNQISYILYFLNRELVEWKAKTLNSHQHTLIY